MKLLAFILLSYLIGSIPFSYLSSRIKGKDPRTGGTGNIGASNVLVVAGPIAGVVALAGDIAKGSFSILLARHFNLSDWGITLCGLAVIIGHDFSLFLRFSGGKGVATTGGILLALDPLFAILALLLWIITMFTFRYFIPSTIFILAFIPVMMWMGSFRFQYILFAIGAFLLGLYTHSNDLQRYLAGNELTIADSMAKHLKK